jgi:hypothetical protein
LFERGVILAPVVDAVRGLLFHRKKSIQRHCIRNSSLRFVQQSLFFSQPEVLLFHLFIIEAMQQIIKQLS